MADPVRFPFRHVLGLRGLQPWDLAALLDRAETLVATPPEGTLSGCRLLQLSFVPATGLEAALSVAAERLGAATETVRGDPTIPLDIRATVARSDPDIVTLRHPAAGAAERLVRHTGAVVVDAGGGSGEHPIQALVDALAIRRAKGRIEGLIVTLCGDIGRQGLARSSVLALAALGAQVRLCGPSTLLAAGIDRLGVTVTTDIDAALRGADVVSVLPLGPERFGADVPTPAEFRRFFGLDAARLRLASPDVKVLHAGPVGRGVEIDAAVADGPASLIGEQDALAIPVCTAILEAVGRPKTDKTP